MLHVNPFVEKCRELDALFRAARKRCGEPLTLCGLFEREADALCDAHRAGRVAVTLVILNGLAEKPGWLACTGAGEVDTTLLANELGGAEARRALARLRRLGRGDGRRPPGSDSLAPRSTRRRCSNMR